ncbi:hypothetical protein ACFQH6_20585 [Halobacteriaceae archaeon GCM10025711]
MVNKTEPSGIRRREVLSAAGSVAAIGAIPTVSAKGKKDRILGKRQFIEIAIRHEEIPDVEVPNRILGSVDPMSHFVLDPREKVLELRPPIGSRKLNKFRKHGALAAFGLIPGYFPIGETITPFEEEHPQIDRLRYLQAVNDYRRPDIKTEQGSSGSVSVEVKGNSVTVGTGGSDEIYLDPISVKYHRDDGERITVEGKKGEKIRARKARIDTINLTPIVSIRNHGKLDVVEPEEVLE